MPPKKQDHAAALAGLWTILETAMNETDAVARGNLDTKITHKWRRSAWYQKCYQVTSSDVDTMKALHAIINKWVDTTLAPSLRERILPAISDEATGGMDSTKLFAQVAKVYEQFRISRMFASSIASNIDQGLDGREGIPTLAQMYHKSFHGLVYDDVKKPLRECILRKVNMRREGNQIDMKELRNATDFLITVGTASSNVSDGDELYSADIEAPYIQCLVDFYSAKAAGHLSQEGGHYTYLQWVESRFELEKQLTADLMRSSSHLRVMAELEGRLLGNYKEEIIQHPDSGFQCLLDDWKTPEIKRMYSLFKRVPEDEATKLMGKELTTKLITVVQAPFDTFTQETPSNDRNLVEDLLRIHTEYSKLVTDYCENSADLHRAIKEAFVNRVNAKLKANYQKSNGSVETKEVYFAYILSVYVSQLMKGELKIAEADEETETLEKLAIQFNHLKEKDIFQDEHKGKLANRLLHGTSGVSRNDLEKQFLQMIQRSMGTGFIHKMESMINDIEGAQASCDQFLEQAKDLPCGFECRVLCAASWPSYKACELIPSPSLGACMRKYSHFYKQKYATRDLKWIHMLGSSNLTIRFPKGTKDVSCSTYQAHILMLVDDKGIITAGEIAEHLKLDFEKTIRPNIHSMYLSKQFPLLITGLDDAGKPLPVSREVPKDTKFMLNPTFQFKLRKIKVPQLQSSGSSVSKEDIDVRRKHMIDACIVRVMKSRRVLVFNELVTSVIDQLSKIFTPQPKHIKNQIEELIKKEYLKRDPEQQNKFEYLA